MKIISLMAGIGLTLVLLMSDGVLAQGGGSRRIHYSTLFNPATVGTVSGEVVRVEQVLSGNGQDYCVHAILKTPQGQVTAILGPKGYLTKQGLVVAPQDKVTVSGSRLTILGKPCILVTQMTGDRTMKLREANGRPAWAVGEDWHVR
ncbi:MAG: hypothetical protein AB1491_01670 [Thermodesulfobacteriota bacterium]